MENAPLFPETHPIVLLSDARVKGHFIPLIQKLPRL